MIDIYLELFEEYPMLSYGIVFFLGLCLGSFTSAISYRIPYQLPWAIEKKEGKWTAVRSMCPTCKTTLQGKDLIPVLSWAMAGAKCNYCAQKISVRYPLQELSMALAGCFLVYLLGIDNAYFWAIFLSLPFIMALLASLIVKKRLSFQTITIISSIWLLKIFLF
jgi:prepilin signal peptidase PulO-like enzyme (type II secretory pathway)